MGSAATVVYRCEICNVELPSIFDRKKCRMCPKMVCSKCLDWSRENTLILGKRFCKKCSKLHSGNFTRQDLQSYSIRELRNFLLVKNVSVINCRERNDLVDLMLRCSNFRNQADQSSLEHLRHIELLRERMRNENTEGDNVPLNPLLHSTTRFHSESDSTALNVTTSNVEDNGNLARRPTELERRIDNLSNTLPNAVPSADDILECDANTSCTDGKYKSVDDIKEESELGELSVLQLKKILARNYIDYKGCCEKSELLDRVTRLWMERKKTREDIDIDKVSMKDLCKICMDATIDCLLLECGHMVTCTTCGKRLAECPICRCFVSRVVHVFRS